MPLRKCLGVLLAGMWALTLCASAVHAQAGETYRFSVSFAREQSAEPLDGRILLLLSTDGSAEPRTQISDSPRTQMIFGLDMDGLKPAQSVIVDDAAYGYPVRYLRDVPSGEYYVQAVLHATKLFIAPTGTR